MAEARLTARQRLERELVEYAAVSAYLWICFGAIMLYRAAILEDVGIGSWHYGLALVKALILGKFMLLGRAARVGERMVPGRPLFRILWRSLATLALLMLLTLVEHLVGGLLHGLTAGAALAEATQGRLPELAASCLLMMLILLPWFAWREFDEALGEGALRRILLAPRRL